MIAFYTKQRLSLFGSFLLIVSFFAPILVSAATAEAPVTKCVTAATVKLKTAAIAQLEKDVAPYREKADEAMLKVIEAYRQGLATAWAAMEEPYCGYGVYGSKSAVKSYSKSVLRARTAFLTQSKKVAAGQGATVAVAVTPTEVPVVAVKPPVQPVAKKTFTPGLKEGMRSEQVMELQKKLAAYFKLKADDSRVTGYFGPLTKQSLLKFQIARGIVKSASTPGAGQVGPKTAAALNQL